MRTFVVLLCTALLVGSGSYFAGKRVADKYYAKKRPQPIVLVQIDASDPHVFGRSIIIKDISIDFGKPQFGDFGSVSDLHCEGDCKP